MLQQEIFWVKWEPGQKAWTSQIDGNAVKGGWSHVMTALNKGDWEVVAITPVQWSARYGSKVPGVLDQSSSSLDLAMVTARRAIEG